MSARFVRCFHRGVRIGESCGEQTQNVLVAAKEQVTGEMRHAQEANAAAKARVSTLRLGAQTPSEVLRQFDTLEKAIVEATQARGRARAPL